MSLAQTSLFDHADPDEDARALAEAEDALASGQLIGHQAMRYWLLSWGQPEELPPPSVDQ
jgi:predicted transcriptional regulator